MMKVFSKGATLAGLVTLFLALPAHGSLNKSIKVGAGETSDGESQITRMNQLLDSPPSWVDETSPQWTVNWLKVPSPDVPADQRGAVDYLQEDVSPPGFDNRTLPLIPLLQQPGSLLRDPPPLVKDPGNDTDGVRSALRNSRNPEEL